MAVKVLGERGRLSTVHIYFKHYRTFSKFCVGADSGLVSDISWSVSQYWQTCCVLGPLPQSWSPGAGRWQTPHCISDWAESPWSLLEWSPSQPSPLQDRQTDRQTSETQILLATGTYGWMASSDRSSPGYCLVSSVSSNKNSEGEIVLVRVLTNAAGIAVISHRFRVRLQLVSLVASVDPFVLHDLLRRTHQHQIQSFIVYVHIDYLNKQMTHQDQFQSSIHIDYSSVMLRKLKENSTVHIFKINKPLLCFPCESCLGCDTYDHNKTLSWISYSVKITCSSRKKKVSVSKHSLLIISCPAGVQGSLTSRVQRLEGLSTRKRRRMPSQSVDM